jgi:hypothetical protein
MHAVHVEATAATAESVAAAGVRSGKADRQHGQDQPHCRDRPHLPPPFERRVPPRRGKSVSGILTISRGGNRLPAPGF